MTYEELKEIGRGIMSVSADAKLMGLEGAVMYLDMAFDEVLREAEGLKAEEEEELLEEE